MTDIKTVGVLGCGLMGSGIAQIAATAGYDTIVREVSDELLKKGKAGIEKSLAKFVEKGKLTGDAPDATLTRLSLTTKNADLQRRHVVIEAVTADLAIHKCLRTELGGL